MLNRKIILTLFSFNFFITVSYSLSFTMNAIPSVGYLTNNNATSFGLTFCTNIELDHLAYSVSLSSLSFSKKSQLYSTLYDRNYYSSWDATAYLLGFAINKDLYSTNLFFLQGSIGFTFGKYVVMKVYNDIPVYETIESKPDELVGYLPDYKRNKEIIFGPSANIKPTLKFRYLNIGAPLSLTYFYKVGFDFRSGVSLEYSFIKSNKRLHEIDKRESINNW